MDIVVVGPHHVVRVGLRLIVEARPGWRVVGEAGADDLPPLPSRPDIVLVDVDRPGPSPARVLTRLAGRFPGAPIIAIGTPDGAGHSRRALTAGASAYVAKETVDRVLISTLDAMVGSSASEE